LRSAIEVELDVVELDVVVGAVVAEVTMGPMFDEDAALCWTWWVPPKSIFAYQSGGAEEERKECPGYSGGR
jgi:hypothetical protein